MTSTEQSTAETDEKQASLAVILSELEHVSESARVEISRDGGEWSVFIRPIGGGFPLRKSTNKSLKRAITETINLWEAA